MIDSLSPPYYLISSSPRRSRRRRRGDPAAPGGHPVSLQHSGLQVRGGGPRPLPRHVPQVDVLLGIAPVRPQDPVARHDQDHVLQGLRHGLRQLLALAAARGGHVQDAQQLQPDVREALQARKRGQELQEHLAQHQHRDPGGLVHLRVLLLLPLLHAGDQRVHGGQDDVLHHLPPLLARVAHGVRRQQDLLKHHAGVVPDLWPRVRARVLGHVDGLDPLGEQRVGFGPGLHLGDHAHELVHGLHGLVLAPGMPLDEGKDGLQEGHEVLPVDLRAVDENLQDLEPGRRGLQVVGADPEDGAEGLPTKLGLDAVGAPLDEVEELREELGGEDVRHLGVQLENQREGPQELVRDVLLVRDEPLADPEEPEDGLLDQGAQERRRVDDGLEVVECVRPEQVEPVPVLDGGADQEVQAEQGPLLLLFAVRNALGGLPRRPDESRDQAAQRLGLQKLALREDLLDVARLDVRGDPLLGLLHVGALDLLLGLAGVERQEVRHALQDGGLQIGVLAEAPAVGVPQRVPHLLHVRDLLRQQVEPVQLEDTVHDAPPPAPHAVPVLVYNAEHGDQSQHGLAVLDEGL
mmetsp:Transcript_7129/g.24524  ORF Transcript_7129/g.24524 Transcript_7129/m.24524 type:complete len:576 (-) Transcript_7129:2719-4446(-)